MAPSFVWKHFKKVDKDYARCIEPGCDKQLMFTKGIAGMVYHLKSIHKISGNPVNEKRPAAAEGGNGMDQEAKRQKTMTDFLLKRTLEEEVSRLVAESNFTFNQIATTPFIRRALKKEYPGRKIPRHNQGVSKLVLKFHKSAEAVVKVNIQKLVSDGTKFSATLDEWTSFGNHRYLDVNLHYKSSPDGKTSFVNLGLFHIKDSLPAPKMYEMFRDLLSGFGVSILTDIVTVTGDGAPVMTAFGDHLKLIGVPYLICLNHTINLAVRDKIFTKKVAQVQDESSDEEEVEENDEESNDERVDPPEEPDLESDMDFFTMEPDYENTINRMRAVIKMFRLSPTKVGYLDAIMVEDNVEKKLKLIDDVATRWNSLVKSATNFLKILPSVTKALNHKEIKKPDMWSFEDTEVLKVC